MCRIKVLKKRFSLTLAFLTWAQVANAELDASFIDDHPPPTTASFASGTTPCPYDQICTGDIVLITMSDLSAWKGATLLRTTVTVAKDAHDLTKGYLPVRSDEPPFHGFYYRVKPNKAYYFKVVYSYRNGTEEQVRHVHSQLYYKSRGDKLNPGSGTEGPISLSEAKAMELPPITKCPLRSPGQFCINQVVHVFWNNDRGEDKSVLDVDLYIDGKHIKHDNGPDYRGHFQDFYYTLPLSKYSGEPVGFQVAWTVRRYRPPWTSHYEKSQTLVNKYTPWAFACKLDGSWQKCQDHSGGGL